MCTYQKKAGGEIFLAERQAHAKPLIRGTEVVNVYHTNTYQNLILIYKVHTDSAPFIFLKKFTKIVIIRELSKSTAIIKFLNRQKKRILQSKVQFFQIKLS